MVGSRLRFDPSGMPRQHRARFSVLAGRPVLRDRSELAASSATTDQDGATGGHAETTADPDSPRRSSRRRPLVLGLVYGVFLILAAITTTAQAIVATSHFSAQTLNATIARDRTLVRIFVDGNLQPSDLALGGDPARVELLQRQLAAYVERGEILRVELRSLDGHVLLSNDTTIRGVVAPSGPGLDRALAGQISAEIVSGTSRHAGAAALPTDAVLEEYVPLAAADGAVLAVFGIWRDAQPILDALTGIRNDSVTVTLSAAAVLALILFVTFRAANARIAGQTAELLESTRRDPLTGLLNHGALVAVLAETVDDARTTGDSVGIALVDIDNFRLLNDTYGHGPGDATLQDVAGRLLQSAPPGTTLGRYGPDEFLIVTPGAQQDVVAIVERLRVDIATVAMMFDSSERLPLTLSAGICAFPDHAAAVTELLASATVALREAKASGGDRVVVANVHADDARSAGGFDVLQGLIIAVDTKDRYTKRHSEDVARYALFLAELIDLDEEFKRSLKIAGLLHDVGKIGIPDEILRKPGKLTQAEFEIVKQHVKLGDLIVRDLPNVDFVRAGIRHHHERWDGDGYLHGLAGEDIPLVARVLSVADAFSAMTTSRPYRKALSVLEALRRLEDASDTQLEGRLVTAFINGIETADNPPLPGMVSPPRLWTPLTEVA